MSNMSTFSVGGYLSFDFIGSSHLPKKLSKSSSPYPRMTSWLSARLRRRHPTLKHGVVGPKRESTWFCYDLSVYTPQGRHYQDIIKQMEANQPRSDSTARSSSYLRKHLQELPTLRPVHPPKDLDHDEEEYPFTPKKRRESAPIIMTPLRPSASSYVGLTQSRQQPPKFEFD